MLVASFDNVEFDPLFDQIRYPLTFINGVARTTITLYLEDSSMDGRVFLGVQSSSNNPSAVIVDLLSVLTGSISIFAPQTVMETVTGGDISFDVRIEARDETNTPENPPGLFLRIAENAAVNVPAAAFPLSFSAGSALVPLTVSLNTPGVPQSITLTVIGGSQSPNITVRLVAIELLRSLTIAAPDTVRVQPADNGAVDFMVTVRALSSYNRRFDPGMLKLRLSTGNNIAVTQSSYNLTFSGDGEATVTVQAVLQTGVDVDRIMFSVMSDNIGGTATVFIARVPESLTALTLDAPKQVLQTATDAELDFVVTVSARSNYLRRFDPQGVVLQISADTNADLMQSAYTLNFIDGVARTVVTLALTEQGINGSVELTVSGGALVASTSITLRAVELLAVLAIDAPQRAFQDAIGNDIRVAVAVRAVGTQANALNPQGLVLVAIAGANTVLSQGSYPLNFASGVANTVVPAGLALQQLNGNLRLRVRSGELEATRAVELRAVQTVAVLGIGAPEQVQQGRSGESLSFTVTVLATNTLGNLYDYADLELGVTDAGNALVEQSTYVLSFVGGQAQALVTVNLAEQGTDGSVMLQVASGDGSAVATVALIAVQRPGTLNIVAPARVLQDTIGDDFTVAVQVQAEGTPGNSFNPQNLVLEVMAGANTVLEQSTYPLSFASGIAEVVVTAGVAMQQVNGSLQLSVRSGDVASTAAVELRAVQTVAALEIEAPQQALQGRTGARLSFAVTVSATNTLGNPYAYADLQLAVTDAGNARVGQSTYILSFVNGQAQTTVTVNLIEEGTDGSVMLQVVSGSGSATATVALIAAEESLSMLNIVAPARALQDRIGDDLTVAVAVRAVGTLGSLFNPEALVLELMAGVNAVLVQSTYALSFASGLAEVVVTAGVAMQQVNGNLLLRVRSGDIESTRAVELRAVQTVAALAIEAPEQVQQDSPGEHLSFAVTVSATNTLGNPYAYADLELAVTNGFNARLDQSTYVLSFVGGQAQAQVVVNLVIEGDGGSVILHVASGNSSARATVELVAVADLGMFSIVAPARVLQNAIGDDFAVAVQVLAVDRRGNAFDLTGLGLEAVAGGNTVLSQGSYPLNFVSGVADVEVTAELVAQQVNGSLLLRVRSGAIESTAAVELRAVQTVAALAIDAPQQALQGRTGERLSFAVTVSATNTLGNPYAYADLELVVTDAGNARVGQSTYVLSFVDGQAQAQVTVNLAEEGTDGSVMLQVASGNGSATATVALIAAEESLGMLIIETPPRIFQGMIGDDFTAVAVVRAVGTLGSAFNPEALVLEAMAGANTVLMQSTWPLSFVSGVANEVVIMSSLVAQQINGSLQLSVRAAAIESTRVVELRAVQTVAALAIEAPEQVQQGRTGEPLSFAVTVSATNTLGNPYAYVELELAVTDLGNARVDQSTYSLSFANGQAVAQVTVNLAEQSTDGRVMLQVVSGNGSARATVALIVAPESLGVLNIVAPTSATQSATGESLEIVVAVTAIGTLGNSFNPEGVTLQVLPASNSIITTNTYSLNFAGGVATTTITVALDTQGLNGSVVLLLISEKAPPPQVVLLQAVELLGSLVVDAPAVVLQQLPDAELSFTVRILATGTQGNAFEPEELSLVVAAVSNATVEQGLYPLVFTAGETRVAVSADLIDQDSNGELLLLLMGQPVAVLPQSVRVELLRAFLTGAELTLDTPDLIQQRIGEAVETTLTITVFGNGRQVFPLSGLSLTYSAIPELAAISLSTQQLLFQAPQSGVVSSVTVRVSVLPPPAQNSAVSFSLAGFVLGAVDVSPAILRVTAVPRRLAVVSLSLADPVVRQLVADEAVAVTLTVVARDNYQQPIAVATVALTATATAGAIVNIPQISVGESGVAAVGVEVTLSDHRDTRVTIQLRRGDLAESVSLLPEAGVVAVIEAVPVLRNVVLELLTAAGDLRQIDPRLPVQFEVRISALDQNGRAIGIERLELQVEVDPSSARFTLDSEVTGFTAAGALVRVFVLPVQVMDTTVTLQATDLDTNIASTRLSVRVQADTRAPIEPLDLTGDGVVSAVDLIFADRWLYYNRPADITAALAINLPLRTAQITTASYTNMKELLAVDSDRGDINNDGQVDQFDVRSMLHYLSDMPVSRLDGQVDVNLLRLLLGQELQYPAGL